jgi:hypothetical protein
VTERLCRQQLIFPVAFFDSALGSWTASVHLEFTEKFKIHTLVIKSSATFTTEALAKKFVIEEAKQLVDDRLLRACTIPSAYAMPPALS